MQAGMHARMHAYMHARMPIMPVLAEHAECGQQQPGEKSCGVPHQQHLHAAALETRSLSSASATESGSTQSRFPHALANTITKTTAQVPFRLSSFLRPREPSAGSGPSAGSELSVPRFLSAADRGQGQRRTLCQTHLPNIFSRAS